MSADRNDNNRRQHVSNAASREDLTVLRSSRSLAMSDFHHTGAFVVQFRTTTDFGRGIVEGRVEHVASGRIAHFTSITELLESFARLGAAASSEEESRRAD